MAEYKFGDTEAEFTKDIGEILLPYVSDMLIVRLEAEGILEEYFFTGNRENPFKPFTEKKEYSLNVNRLSVNSFEIKNVGAEPAMFINLIAKNSKGEPLVLSENTRTLFKNESFTVKANEEIAEISVFPLN